ncbi:MAG TPA: histidine phosphatase family protein [Acidimicrobiales bacterium]|nr:histidine phosphatase family protein [Acidimicrobiales bacterium]
MTGRPGDHGRLLWILRHAKAVADPPRGKTDHDRTLSPRGRRDAEALGRRLGGDGDRMGLGLHDLPRAVVCSTAARTVETARLVLASLPEAPPVRLCRSLYAAAPEEIMNEVRELDEGTRTAMVVGHNPGVHQLAMELLQEGPAADRLDREGFPTCAVAIVGLPVGRWDEVIGDTGRLVGFYRPPYASG